MSNTSNNGLKKFGRRHFLVGATGATMALPFLPSLMSKAYAAENAFSPHRCFMAIGTDHGGIWAKNMYPDASVLTQQVDYASRTVNYGDLPTTTMVDGELAFSPVCQSAALTPALIGKFNILRGLDIPYRISHHTGGHLGNFAETAGFGLAGVDSRRARTATLDQRVAWSSTFYDADDLTSRMTQRSFNVADGKMSWNFSSPSTQSGGIVRQPSSRSNIDLFRYLFDPATTYNNVDTYLVDRIKASYARLRQHPRLSYGDRNRLDQHVESMFEIERKLSVMEQLVGVPTEPAEDSSSLTGATGFGADPAANLAYAQLMNDIIVAGFSAGVSRVGTWFQGVHFASEQVNDWHGMVAHQGYGEQIAQAHAAQWHRGTFGVMADLAAKMDAVTTSDGATLLDNSLIMMTSEAGQLTHHTSCMGFPVVTAGSAGGYFNTGSYVDFRNRATTFDDLAELVAANDMLELENPGLYYNQFLGNVMQSMGVAQAEYETFEDFLTAEPTRGFGLHHVDAQRATDYAAARLVMGEDLPVLTLGA